MVSGNPAPTPHVKVTLDAIHADLLVICAELVALNVDEARTDVSDHEQRIRSLERKIWTAAGAAAVAGGVLGQISGMLLGS